MLTYHSNPLSNPVKPNISSAAKVQKPHSDCLTTDYIYSKQSAQSDFRWVVFSQRTLTNFVMGTKINLFFFTITIKHQKNREPTLNQAGQTIGCLASKCPIWPIIDVNNQQEKSREKSWKQSRKSYKCEPKKSTDTADCSIFNLKIHIFNLKMSIFSLKIDICKLKIEPRVRLFDF